MWIRILWRVVVSVIFGPDLETPTITVPQQHWHQMVNETMSLSTAATDRCNLEFTFCLVSIIESFMKSIL